MLKVAKIFAFSLMVFVIIYLTYLPYKERDIENTIDQINDINTQFDEELMKSIEVESVISSGFSIEAEVDTGVSQEEIYKNIIIDQLADIDEITEVLEQNKGEMFDEGSLRFQKLYVSSMNKKNVDTAIRSIEYILKETPNDTAWMKKLIDLLVQTGQYDKAENYMKDLLKLDHSSENIKTFIYIKLQNINYYNKEEVKELRKVIRALYKKRIISYEDYSFYSFLSLLISDWEGDEIRTAVEGAQSIFSGDRLDLAADIKDSFRFSDAYAGSKPYFPKALVSLNLLQYGYFGLSKKMAQEVYAIDPNYVLPIQVLAYSNFFIGNYNQSLDRLDKLKSLDGENQEYYNLFIGVANYWDGEYLDSLLYLDQLSNTTGLAESDYLDILRYKFLNYKHLKDDRNMAKVIKEIRYYPLNLVDYYNFFNYLLFKCEDCYDSEKELVIQLIKNCYNDLPESQIYMCWYGKANLYYQYKKYDLSTEYYEKLSEFFQDAYIFERIGDHYSFSDKDKARVYYFKALMYSAKEGERKIIKDKIKEMFR